MVDATGENRTGKCFDRVEFFAANPIVMEQYGTVVATGDRAMSTSGSYEKFFWAGRRRYSHSPSSGRARPC